MTRVKPPNGNLAEVKRALRVLKAPGDVVELRALGVSERSYRAPHTVSGYFDDFDKLAAEAARLTPSAWGVYITLNEIDPSLLARAANRVRVVGRGEPTTSDHQVIRRRWLLVDIDPIRSSGISSSETEWRAAHDAAVAIRTYLTAQDWSTPVLATSGNGFHLLYRIDLPTDDDGLVKRVLQGLAFRFNDDAVEVDETVFNPARISRLYGTVARKGDHIAERPHRMARILDAPESLDVVPRELLERLAQAVPTPEQPHYHAPPRNDGGFDLDGWMNEHFPEADGPAPWDKGRRWIFPTCPWDPDHQDRAAYVVQFRNGAVAAGCHHNGCSGRGWHDLRDVAESGWRERASGRGLDAAGESKERLEELFERAVNAKPEARSDALMALARGVSRADPFTITAYARRIKEAGLANIGTFSDAVKRAQGGGVQRRQSGNDKSWLVVSERGLPRINAGDRELPRVTKATWEAIQKANRDPYLFRFGGLPARIETGDDGTPNTQPLNDARMRHVLARVATWYQVTDGDEEIPALPPAHVVSDVLATPDMPLPILEGIVSSPVFARDGTILTTPGYHPQACMYYHPPSGFAIPDVPERPSDEDVERAKMLLLDELLVDFPFVENPDGGDGQPAANAERAHAVAMVIQPFARQMITGATPLYLIEKPSPGTGASLLVDVLVQVVTGRPVMTMTEGRNDDEWRKRLTAKLLDGPQFIVMDNLRRKLDSSALAAAITTPMWEDRILGQSTVARIPVRCEWIATGNNPVLSDEIARRCVRIRMDAKCDQPWLRRSFKHPQLVRWVRAHRSELVWAALTLVQNWIARGRPVGDYTLGMFQSWADTMGGILDAAGIAGFLGNLADFYDKVDVQGAIWRTLVAAWWERFGGESVGVSDLFALVARLDMGLDLGTGKERSQRTRLGLLLNEQRDRRYQVEISGEMLVLQIARAGTKQRANQWRLICQNTPETVNVVNVSERLAGQNGGGKEKNIHFSGDEHGERCPDEPETVNVVNVSERLASQNGGGKEKNIHSSGIDKEGCSAASCPPDGQLAADPPVGCSMYPHHRRFWRRPTEGWICYTCHPPVSDDVEIVELEEIER